MNYLYNGLEQRAQKTGPTALVPTGASYYIYDEQGQLLGEYDASGAPVWETIYLGSTPVGVLKQTGSAANNDLAVTLYNVYADQIDTPRVITKQDHTIVWRWDTAEAFGATAPDQDPSSLGAFTFNQRFPGQVFDAETGLNQNWNREYNARTGRYIESDPIGLKGGINTYLYAQATPTARTDPTGLFTSSTHNEITAAAIAIAGSPCPNLPAAVAMADWFPGAQAPRNAYWHHMSDGTDASETVDKAKDKYDDFVGGQQKTCTCEGLARAMHAIQDSYARGHANFQPWSGGLPSMSHAHADAYPSKDEHDGAVNASVALIRKFGKECANQCPR